MSTFTKTELLPGAKVKLRTHPEGEEGVIERIVGGKAVVHWPHCTTRHTLDRLVAAPASAPRINPYQRMLRKLDEDNARAQQK